MFRIGLIGAGGIAGQHLRAFSQIDDVAITAVADIDVTRAERRAAECGARPFTRHQDVLDLVDAVVICTPPSWHRAPTVDAAQAGKHVFCEKPIALTLEDADAMIAAAQAAGVVLQIGHNFHFEPHFRAMHDLFAAGTLGELVYCWFQQAGFFAERGWEARRREQHWRLTPEQSGGRLFEQIHIVNWLAWIGGPARRAYGRMATITPDLAVDEWDLAIFDFEHGYGKAELSLTPCTIPERSAGILGRQGSVILRQGQLVRRTFDGPEEELLPPPVISRQEHFIACIRNGSRPENDAHQQYTTETTRDSFCSAA
ncbi:MAG: Gfo/Idh/MocA family oxidoreductase, partial [Chloroflexi bacterium]|nr:Gfo/Idh/MocA family oxidoreductase [Chloroflexota bacterium]